MSNFADYLTKLGPTTQQYIEQGNQALSHKGPNPVGESLGQLVRTYHLAHSPGWVLRFEDDPVDKRIPKSKVYRLDKDTSITRVPGSLKTYQVYDRDLWELIEQAHNEHLKQSVKQ